MAVLGFHACRRPGGAAFSALYPRSRRARQVWNGTVSHQAGDNPPAVRRPALDLAAAYSELHNLVLAGPDVAAFLRQLATLSAALVPLTSCGVMMRRDHQAATAGSSDKFAMQLGEIQYTLGQGPCLQALRTGQCVQVTDLDTEDRWGDYRIRALAAGARSSV